MKTPKLSLSTMLCLLLTLMAFLPSTASAHSETGTVGGFISGFKHPITGLDHIVAMVAVGLWGAFLGGRAMWMLPVVFPVVMAFGGALGVLGVPIPYVETGIAISGVILGSMVAFAVKPPLWVAAVIVGFFAIFHGVAHGRELPQAANAMTYAVGFVISTGMLHLSGIVLGLLVRWPWGRIAVRVGGVVIALIGFGFFSSSYELKPTPTAFQPSAAGSGITSFPGPGDGTRARASERWRTSCHRSSIGSPDSFAGSFGTESLDWST